MHEEEIVLLISSCLVNAAIAQALGKTGRKTAVGANVG